MSKVERRRRGPLRVGGERPADAGLPRRGVGRPRARPARAVGEADARRLPGRAGVDHRPAQARRVPRAPSQDFDPEGRRPFGEAGRRRACSATPASSARAPRSRRRSAAPALYLRDARRAARTSPTFCWSFSGRRRAITAATARRPGADAAVRASLEGAEAARLQVRRPGDRLRLDAGGRDRRRP